MNQIYADKQLNNIANNYEYSKEASGKEASLVASNYGEGVNDIESVIYDHDAKKINDLTDSIMDNFEEYLKDMQEKAKEEGIDEDARERQAKEATEEMIRNLSTEELKQLELMGIDISNVRLSDIRGLVGTMRQNVHKEELQQLMANINVKNNDLEAVAIIGENVKVAGSNIELDDIDVSDVVADDFKVSNKELLYLLKNNLTVNKENLYKAHYSGIESERVKKDVTDIFEQVLSQIEKVIEQAGYEVDETTLPGARLLMENQLPVTTDTIRAYMDFQSYINKSISEVASIQDGADIIEEKAQKLYETVKNINPEIVYDMALNDKNITIASVVQSLKNNDGKVTENIDYSKTDARNIKAITAMRQMEEIRLNMTREAAGRLVRLDINIDTRELSKVVSNLRSIENQMIKESLQNNGLEPTDDNVSTYKDISEKVYTISQASAKILASPITSERFTVNSLYQAHENNLKEPVNKEFYETVKRSYEAVGTAPRSDMGDSITKAFSNVDSILNELGIEVNYENQRAVRILGYNSMDITGENIASVVEYDRQVNTLINSFYPEAVLGIIKDGINPLDIPIDDLNRIIKERNYNEGVTEAENFARYLMDMEKQGALTELERESYIGIYRAMDKLAKSGDKEAGWLFANGGRLTVRNLVNAMRSRKATGFNVAVDENFGMVKTVDAGGKRIDEQISAAFNNQTIEFMKENDILFTTINMEAVNKMLSTDGGIYQLVSDILAKIRFDSKAKERLIDSETENMTDSLTENDIPVEFTPNSILESLISSESMSIKYEDLRNQLTELMYEAGVSGTMTQMDISVVKTINAGFNILNKMAQNDRYQVPVETEQGIKIVNLSIRHAINELPAIDISLESAEFSLLKAKVYVIDDNRLEGYFVSDTSDGNYALIDQEEIFKQIITNYGYKCDDISIGSVRGFSKEELSGHASDTGKLYQVSISLVKAIGTLFA